MMILVIENHEILQTSYIFSKESTYNKNHNETKKMALNTEECSDSLTKFF